MKSLFTMLSISRLLPFILSVLCFQLCIAQMAHENIPVTNGRVSSLVRDGNTIYIGGNFTGLGPNVPKGSSISTTTGLFLMVPVAGILVGSLHKLVLLPETI